MIEVSADLKDIVFDIKLALVFPFFVNGFAVAIHFLIGSCELLDAYNHFVSTFIMVYL